MNESISELESAIKTAKNTLVNAMTNIVMKYGDDFHDSYDYYCNDFGIDEEETEENTKVLKIIDMFSNGGCCFSYGYMHNVTIPTKRKKTKIYWYTSAFGGLYVVEEDKKLYLKYYRFDNEGRKYNSYESEPDHYYVTALTLEELEKLMKYLLDYLSQRSSVHVNYYPL